MSKNENVDFDQGSYDLFIQCVHDNNLDKWNELKLCANLESANFKNLQIKNAIMSGCNMRNADFSDCTIENSNFSVSKLEAANFDRAILKNVDFTLSRLEDADFPFATLDNVSFSFAKLRGVNFNGTTLKIVEFLFNDLKNANFNNTAMEGADLKKTFLNNDSIFKDCKISKTTDMRTPSFYSAQFSSGLKQSFEYCNRRHNWEDWYKTHKLVTPFIRFFWWLSDYGRSTKNLLIAFFGISFISAIIFFIYPEIVVGLCPSQPSPPLTHFQLFSRSLYFSIITMTTLGFGEINANPYNQYGHWIIIFLVIVGYFILGALITRLSILFNSDGPAHPFEDEKIRTRRYNAFFQKIIYPIKYLANEFPRKYPLIFLGLYFLIFIFYIYWDTHT